MGELRALWRLMIFGEWNCHVHMISALTSYQKVWVCCVLGIRSAIALYAVLKSCSCLYQYSSAEREVVSHLNVLRASFSRFTTDTL